MDVEGIRVCGRAEQREAKRVGDRLPVASTLWARGCAAGGTGQGCYGQVGNWTLVKNATAVQDVQDHRQV